MKKTYTKPNLHLECFSLTQNIALNCGVPHKGNDYGTHTHNDIEQCGWDDGDGLIFWTQAPTCNMDGDKAAWFCYNNPESGMTVFGS